MEIKLQKIINYLRDNYEIEVKITGSEEDGVNIAAIEGKKIIVNKNSRAETEQIFVIGHLFGHMVQFSNYEKYRYLLEEAEKPKPLLLDEKFKNEFYKYEKEAYKIGKGLFEETLGKEETDSLDEKYQIFLDTDFSLFWEYLTTGIQASNQEFNDILKTNYRKFQGLHKEKLEAIPLPKKELISEIKATVY